jgi:hypothetical protein
MAAIAFLVSLASVLGVESVSRFGGMTSAAFAAHLADSLHMSGKTLSEFPSTGFRKTGAMYVPRDYTIFRDSAAAALAGNATAAKQTLTMAKEAMDTDTADKVVLAHIAWKLALPSDERTIVEAARRF